MKVLGGKNMLEVGHTCLVYEYWTKSPFCREFLQDPTQTRVFNLIRGDLHDREGKLHNLDFLIWFGTNGAMGIPFNNEEDDDYDPDDLNAVDTNIVGDASPVDTLWFVFERGEWEIIHRETGIDLDGLLGKSWSKWEKEFEGNNHPDWVREYFNQKDVISGYEDITEANIDIPLK